MSARRVAVITGLGLCTPVGCDRLELLDFLRTARSGISLREPKWLQKSFPAGVVARDFSGQFTKLELPFLDRCTQLAIVAARQAVADAGLAQFSASGQRAGLYYGTVIGGAETTQNGFEQLFLEHKGARPYTMMAIMHNAAAAQISIRHQILGPVNTYSTACASSGTAIGEALRAVRDGYLDVAVAGGAEAPLTSGMFSGFDATRALAPPDARDVARSCRPFAKDRAGLVLGEGAAFVVIETEEHARARGAAAYCVLSGYGVASDAYHIGSPKAEGEATAMRLALADAGLAPADIGYFNAHATATRGGDSVEAQALQLAFGDALAQLPVSSSKSVHGHLLGATSALELLITMAALAESMLPATAHLDDVDPACDLLHIANTPVFDRPIEHAMSFSSGFGGTNVGLVISKHRGMPAKCLSDPVSRA